MTKQSIIIYDIETTGIDINEAECKLVGFYSSKVDGFHWTADPYRAAQILNEHDIVVGYNSHEYDDPIMMKYGFSPYKKVNIDLMKIIHGSGFGNDKGRINLIKKDGKLLSSFLRSKSLDATSQALGGPSKVDDFDYSLFKHNFNRLTKEQQDYALEYLRADVDATKFIYEYLEDFFSYFKNGEIDGVPFMTEEQVRKKQYLTASTASWVYKALCNLTGLPEEYNDKVEHLHYEGSFVAMPEHEEISGDIYCLDFSSMYPHIMIAMNLYGFDPDNGTQGDKMCFTEGRYQTDELAPVGRVLKRLFERRQEYKAVKDSREYTLKIIINTVYGLLGNPVFASVYNPVAAADCTRVGRQWIKAARLHFKEHGYDLLYTDTDSVYLRDPFNNKDKMLKIKDKFIQELKAQVFFDIPTFDMTIDAEIKYMGFFKGPAGNFLKKNYIYVTKDDELKVVGLTIIKSNASRLGKHIFDKYIAPKIKREHCHKIDKSEMTRWIEQELEADINLAATLHRVKDVETYKSMSNLGAQISYHLGAGSHWLFKLKRAHTKGLGVGRNYIPATEIDSIRISQLDLSKTWSELEYFIKPAQHSLLDFS